ncbi:hypothetical protein J6590_004513 [Homalodisca vitripennis]|nr:hypothetical protein J6590_004513 [Homalodisca vitripennis]
MCLEIMCYNAIIAAITSSLILCEIQTTISLETSAHKFTCSEQESLTTEVVVRHAAAVSPVMRELFWEASRQDSVAVASQSHCYRTVSDSGSRDLGLLPCKTAQVG